MHEATAYTLLFLQQLYYAQTLLYVCTVIYSLTWPDHLSRRGAIACSISAYAASKNALMQPRVWPHETRSFMSPVLPHGHFNPIASVLLSKSFNTSVRQFMAWVPIVHQLTMHHVSTSSNHWIHFLPKILIMHTTE